MVNRIPLVLAVAMSLPVLAVHASAPLRAEPITVLTRSIPLNPDDLSQKRIGKLLFRGGLVLSSEDDRFGGLSALGVSRDGVRLVALSDRGHRFQAHLDYGKDGLLIGLRDTDIGIMGGLDNKPLSGKAQSDAESMAPGTGGEIIVAFERQHRLWRYFPSQATPEPLPPPEELVDAPSNGGIEALALLVDGRLLALTEKFGRGDTLVGWVSRRQGWSVLTYITRDDFKPAGAATLPDGDVIVVERRFRLPGTFTTRLVRIDGTSISPGARIKGSDIAEIAEPLSVDNFEGIEARENTAGKTMIYLISDNNFNNWQRTLLLMFELTE